VPCAEDLIFGALPIDLGELSTTSPLKSLAAFSPRLFARSNSGPPALATIPSGEPVDAPAQAMPGLERQSTPQIKAS
jgi:hypothetical protein